MPAEIFADGDQDYIEKFNTVAQQAFDGDAAAGRLDDHIDGTADKHGASAIVNTPAGGIAATDVQAAINELDTEKQPIDATLTAFAALTIAADKLPYGNGSDTFGTTDLTSAGRALLDDADAAAQRTTLGLGTAATLASDTDTTLAANSDTRLATQKAVKTYVDAAVTGLWDMKGGTDASANPNYPAASKGDAYAITVAGKIGGASGASVDVGDVYVATADNAGGTQAAVGSNWIVIEHNLAGALLSANNLSDIASASTARTNLGLGTLATQSGTFSGTSSGTNTGDQTSVTGSAGNAPAGTLTGATLAAGVTASSLTSLGTLTSLTTSGQITSSVSTGTAPFSVASTTNVANLNASSLSGATFAAPGTIGGGTPGAATFTTLTVNTQGIFPAGSVGTPGVRVGAEQNGLYSPSANVLDLVVGGARGMRINTTGGTGNWIDASSNNTPLIRADGPGSNIDFYTSSKGTGNLNFFTSGGLYEQMRVVNVTSAVNRWELLGAVTTNNLVARAAGSDTDIGVSVFAKGTSGVTLGTNGSTRQVLVGATASAVNYHLISGGTTGNAPSWAAAGSDSDIDLAVTPKGAGRLRYGTHAAIGALTVTGYIEIKDSGGTVRKLAVVS